MLDRKHILLAILGFVVLLLAVIGYVKFKKEPEMASAFAAMPPSTNAVLSINDYGRAFNNILLNNLMWQELRLDSSIDQLANELILLDSLIQSKEWSAELSKDMHWYLSFQSDGSDYEHVFIVPVEDGMKKDFQDWFQSYSNEIKTYALFEDVLIESCIFKEAFFDPIYFAFHKGLFLASSKPNLVEDALRALNSGNSLIKDANFNEVAKTAGSFADWNFFINYKNIGSLNFLGLNLSSLADSDILCSDWTALDATVHPDLLLLNGFSHAANDSYLSLFERQKSQDVDAIEVIPEGASMFFHFGISNYKDYSKSKRAYFKKIGRFSTYEEKIKRVQETYQIDLENEFDQWVSNEFGLMYLPIDGIEQTASKVAYFRLSDIRRTRSILENLAGLYPEDQVGELPRIPMENFLDDFETVLFDGLNKPYFLILDKYLLIAEYESLLQHVKKQYLKANTLRKSELYATFANNLSDQSNVYIYVHLNKSKKVYQKILNEKSLSFLAQNKSFQEKFEQMGLQFKDGKNDMYYQHVALNYNPQERSQGNLLWETALDTDLLIKPQIVFNHYNNSKEVLMQDVANTLYLLDNKGNLLWKRQMKEKVQSKVYQIDVYKNNKLQMLFSGESSIYLLDRKGRDVENFPVQLPSVSTNDLMVIDYEKNREYRILIGVRGGEILNFDRFGKRIKGWNFKCEEEITYPINYFLLNGKDYIVTASASGKPYVLSRRGDERTKINESLPPYDGRNFTLELSNDINQCRMVTTDASGNFIKLKFNGEKEIVNLDVISDKHQFLYEDINNDRKYDYILIDSSKLMVFNFDKEKIYEIQLEGNSPAFLNMYHFDDGYGKIGFIDIINQQVYLYKDAGGLDNNFPLQGSTPFSITDLNKDGRQNLITGVKNRVVVYNLR